MIMHCEFVQLIRKKLKLIDIKPQIYSGLFINCYQHNKLDYEFGLTLIKTGL